MTPRSTRRWKAALAGRAPLLALLAILFVTLLALGACWLSSRQWLLSVMGTPPEIGLGESYGPRAEVGPPDAFDHLEGFAAVEDLNGLRPAQEYDYWEWQRWIGWDKPTARAAGGRVPQAALDGAVQAALATRLDESGFSPDCSPGQCSEYIVTVRGADVMTLTSAPQVAAFLGEIDTPQDAYLLAYVSGFSPQQVRETAQGYEVLATEAAFEEMSRCSTHWVGYSYSTLLRVSPAGKLELAARKLDKQECMGAP